MSAATAAPSVGVASIGPARGKASSPSRPKQDNDTYNKKDKPTQVRLSNITAAKGKLYL